MTIEIVNKANIKAALKKHVQKIWLKAAELKVEAKITRVRVLKSKKLAKCDYTIIKANGDRDFKKDYEVELSELGFNLTFPE